MSFILKLSTPAAFAAFAEWFVTNKYLQGTIAGQALALQVPRLYGAVIAVNVVSLACSPLPEFSCLLLVLWLECFFFFLF
jgi:hypothetical protein